MSWADWIPRIWKRNKVFWETSRKIVNLRVTLTSWQFGGESYYLVFCYDYYFQGSCRPAYEFHIRFQNYKENPTKLERKLLRKDLRILQSTKKILKFKYFSLLIRYLWQKWSHMHLVYLWHHPTHINNFLQHPCVIITHPNISHQSFPVVEIIKILLLNYD